MKMVFKRAPIVVTTIHTECDKDIKWNISYPLQFRSITEAIPYYFEKIFQKFKVKPTYLLSSEVFDHKEAVDILMNQKDHAELGTHFHGEFLEPNKMPNPSENKDYGCLYEEQIEKAKLTRLTFRFEQTFGFKPLSFAAGRWGATARTAKILTDLDYIADSSVVSFMNRGHLGEGEKSLLRTGEAYFPSSTDIVSSGDLKLVEVPVTALPYSKINLGLLSFSKFIRAYKTWRKGMDRLIWLRPTYSSYFQMKKLIDTIIDFPNSEPIFNIMFHSFEAIPGLSPYVTTQEESRIFITRLEKIFDHLTKKKCVFMTLEKVANMVIKKNLDKD